MKAKEQARTQKSCDTCSTPKQFCRECYNFDKYTSQTQTLEAFQ